MTERKVILYLAQSLDGFIAQPDGNVNFRNALSSSDADASYQEFYQSIDTVLMGRKTYQRAVQLGGDYPYGDKEGYVFSTSLHDTTDNTTVVAGNLVEFVKKLKQKKGKDIWLVGGADLFTELLEAHLVDDIILTIAPVLLGRGINLVATDLQDVPLTLVRASQSGQLVTLHYSINQ